MTKRISRRVLLGSAPLVGAYAQTPTPQAVPNRPPPLEGPLVKEYVIAGHKDLDKTKAMLADNPRLLNATWDWGGGDFETALGGASHMGNREIAQFLLGQGARLDIFAAVMLGRLDIVKAAVAAFPDIHRSLGPHGITMIKHAEKGGAEAAEVLAFLRTLS